MLTVRLCLGIGPLELISPLALEVFGRRMDTEACGLPYQAVWLLDADVDVITPKSDGTHRLPRAL